MSRLDGVEVLGIGEGDRVCDPQSFLLISNSSETANAVGRRFRDALAAPRCVIDLSSDMSAAPVSSLLSPFTRILIGDLPLSFGGALLD
jgi:hypothetical protein